MAGDGVDHLLPPADARHQLAHDLLVDVGKGLRRVVDMVEAFAAHAGRQVGDRRVAGRAQKDGAGSGQHLPRAPGQQLAAARSQPDDGH